MEEKRKIRMPIGAAVACLLIVALLTVGIVAGAKFINNSLSASQTEKNASVQATSAPSGSSGTVGSSGDKTGDLPSDKISYAGSSARPDSEYKTIENCMSSVVSIDVTAQSGHKSVLAGSGSGVIISADGYIVTCNHVVEGAQKIFVYLDNGNDYEATLVGTDSVTDLAVIKINAYNLSYAKFGDSSTLSVGEDVFAIGNALGQLSNTYTRGSISGLDRSITIDNVTMTLGKVLILLGVSGAFTYLLTYLKVPEQVSGVLFSITDNKILILIMLNVLMLLLGCLIEMACLILMLTPVILPIWMSLGLSPIHLGVVMVLNLGIGLLTPPVGSTLFIGSAISGIKIEKLSKHMIPFYLVMGIALLILTYFPQSFMWLPNMAY